MANTYRSSDFISTCPPTSDHYSREKLHAPLDYGTLVPVGELLKESHTSEYSF
jgi:hypothetical protein